MNSIEINELSYSYADNTKALSNLTCSFSAQNIALLGGNGSGKSTFLQHLNGLLLPKKGSIDILGERVAKENLESIRKKVGLVFDHPDHQLFAPTVYEDVAFGLRNSGFSENEVKKRVEETLELLGIRFLKDRPPYNLSLGQKKKVAIAGVVAMEPKVILFDEPFSGLDPASLEEFLELLYKLKILGHTIILSTHDVDIAYHWAEECMLLKDGEIVAVGTAEIMEDQELMERARLSLPSLVTLFQHTSWRPKTIEEARLILTECFAKNKVFEKELQR
ncbi:energy-coupling factor ABC transporter ATP-binding protein [Halalkalibacterium ligniniphilum]|uniref:energy-coupling factor ABC transporter ATP-binding protein n=1 Tax=Halalkalibacterium ligniniphilum TaxID=1134413 RepID=UPI00034C6952|nr:ATP-binding cassette domain-containing protein [Halalkalibacterium ligniniphilum]